MLVNDIAEVLFDVCSDRSLSTKECVDNFVAKTGIPFSDQLQTTIRDYRQTGKNLQGAAESIAACNRKDCDNSCNGCGNLDLSKFTFGKDITFDSALQHFTDRKFSNPKLAAVFVTQYLVDKIDWDNGDTLNLNDIEESFSAFFYNEHVFQCHTEEDLVTNAIECRAEGIVENAYSMAEDEVSELEIDDLVGYATGLYDNAISEVLDPENHRDKYIIIEES